MLTLSAAVMSCAFIMLAVAIWQAQEQVISNGKTLGTTNELSRFLDNAASTLVDARNLDKGCREDRDNRDCNRLRDDRAQFQKAINSYQYTADPDPITQSRLRQIRENLVQASPRTTSEAPDAYAAAMVFGAVQSLQTYEQSRLSNSLEEMAQDSALARQAMFALLATGAVILFACQALLWRGIRHQRMAQKQLEKLNANLTLARREALALSEAKGRFLADMSHEIRTPLNGIVGMASMLSLKDLSPEDSELLRTIRSSSDVLLRVVDDVLDLSKIESNRVELVSRPLELNTLLRDVSRLYKGMAEDQRNRVVIEVPDVETWVLGDAVRLKQVFGNLVSNAVKFCREGEVKVSIESSPEGSHRITVSDTGEGIAPGRLEEIFDEFVQAQIAVSQEHRGTGLGLAIARKLVRRMGGEISVHSHVGVGSEFEVVVPLPYCPAPEVPGLAEGLNLTGLRVLLAEDNNVNVLVATAILERAGCVVEVALDGVQATDMAVNGQFDFVLMDLRMPQRQGAEATRMILDSWKDRPHPPKIIAMTANASPEDREACAAAGMVGFISKPFTYEQLVETLGMLVDRWIGFSPR